MITQGHDVGCQWVLQRLRHVILLVALHWQTAGCLHPFAILDFGLATWEGSSESHSMATFLLDVENMTSKPETDGIIQAKLMGVRKVLDPTQEELEITKGELEIAEEVLGELDPADARKS